MMVGRSASSALLLSHRCEIKRRRLEVAMKKGDHHQRTAPISSSSVVASTTYIDRCVWVRELLSSMIPFRNVKERQRSLSWPITLCGRRPTPVLLIIIVTGSLLRSQVGIGLASPPFAGARAAFSTRRRSFHERDGQGDRSQNGAARCDGTSASDDA